MKVIDTASFPAIDKFENRKERNADEGEWPWPATDAEAKEEYLRLLDTPSGCPFSWLF